MKQNEISSLRGALEQLPTQWLDDMLQGELQENPVDEEKVRLLLRVLEDREMDYPAEVTDGVEQAWKEYQAKTAAKPTRTIWKRAWFLQAAAVLAVVCVLFLIIPQEAEAMTFWERITSWTDSIFELFSPDDPRERRTGYVFETDHPGLQEVYDAVVELGITDPVVPMWLPAEYELVECKMISASSKNGVLARFSNRNNEMVLTVDIYIGDAPYEYYKSEESVKEIEMAGTTHNIMRNKDMWVVIWTRDNVECSIFIDCQEDTLNKILRSIYTMEGV